MGMVYIKTSSKKKMTAKDRKLQQSWDELMRKYPPMNIERKIPEKKTATQTTSFLKAKYDTTVAALAAPKVYTGTKMIGIAAMHKSNLVPIFNDDAAKDVASMRR